MTCENILPVHNCTSSANYKDNPCENLFDPKSHTLWKSRAAGDWVRLDLGTSYRIERLRIHPYSKYVPRNITLQFSDGKFVAAQSNNTDELNEIILPSNIDSYYVNLTIETKHSPDTSEITYIREIQVSGCHPGNDMFTKI